MTSDELAAKFSRKEKKIKKAHWYYRVDRAIEAALRPVLAKNLRGFSAYLSALTLHGQSKNMVAYETGHRVGRAVISGRLPVFAREDMELADILGGIPYSEGLRSARAKLLEPLSRERIGLLELYDMAALETQGLQELYAGFWGFQAAGVDREWLEWFRDTFFPAQDEAPGWF